MKIGVIGSWIFPLSKLGGYAGLEVIAWLIAKGLVEKGHEVTIFGPEGSSCAGANVVAVGPPGQWDEKMAYSKYWPELLKLDAICDHSWQKHSYSLKAEGRLPRTPILGTLHAPVNTMYQSLPPGVEKPCFVCISKDQATHFEQLFNREARVAYNGIDLSWYQAIPGVQRSNRFLFLARFSTIKGPDLAVEAALRAGVGLDMIGDTSITQEPELFKQCTAKCDGKQIKMVGPATRAECVWYLSQAHCMLHPNQRFREPFGLAPVEAQACGVPVICWNMGAMRETVIHGETGYLCKSLEDMVMNIKLLNEKSKEQLDVMRNKCKENASQFSVQNMVDGYEKLVQEAVQTGGW